MEREKHPSRTGKPVLWYRSLAFLGLLGLTLIPLWDMAGIAVIMQTRGHDLVVRESSKLIEELGNTAIAEIGRRSREISALTRSLAIVGETLPRNEALFRRVLPGVLNFHGDQNIAGGGVWPEPYAFAPGRELRSFFYGRDSEGILRYYEDYNSGRGYHREEWYPVVKYSEPGQCFWSRSYMDPHTHQPMVTCSVAMRADGEFSGVSTVDLKLEGLHDFMERIRVKTGGYVFLLDRNNKFLTFPFPERVRRIGTDADGDPVREFLTARDFADEEPLFGPIADAVEAMNAQIIELARRSPNYRSEIVERIDQGSDQINTAEAEYIAAIIADPLGQNVDGGPDDGHLFRKFQIPNDSITGEESIVFIFHVPDSYWKLVAVKPMSEARAVAGAITRVILILIAGTILLGVVLAAIPLYRFFTKPLRETTAAVQRLGALVGRRQFDQLEDHLIDYPKDNELGRLAAVINQLAADLKDSYSSLLDLNANLEARVDERTAEIQRNLEEIRTLKFQQDGDYFLTAQLLKPLGGGSYQSEMVNIESVVSQKKKFHFKRWSDEIGGDICIARSVRLRDRDMTAFLNADAMGKSIQGAGGILVLGAIFNASVERTRLSRSMQRLSPERWLKTMYLESHKVFQTFNGFMLVSATLGLVDEATGSLYFLNAGHPGLVLYRDGRARFLENRMPAHKLGFLMPGDIPHIQTYALEPLDVIFAGSDGRDDLAVGRDDSGNAILNEDLDLFLQHVENGGGKLDAVYDEILKTGDPTDDISLMRIEYGGMHLLKPIGEPDSTPHKRKTENAYAEYRTRNYEVAAEYAREHVESHPHDTDFLYFASLAFFRAARYNEAADAGERYRMRRPDEVRNLRNLARIYDRLGDPDRCRAMLAEAAALRSRA